MTRAQLELRLKWIAAGGGLCLLVVFDDFVAANAGWLRWIAFAGIVLAALSEKRSRSELQSAGRERTAQVMESAPWLKVWFGACAITFMVTAIYVTRHSIDLVQLLGFKFLFVAFAVLLGPFIIVSERQKFKALGDESDAI